MFESFNNFINNSMPLNEGMFSFKTLGDNKAISAMSGADIYMFDDKGNKWHEENYEGYGVFGGKDFFELMAEMNDETGRDIGIDLYFGNDKKVLYPALTRDKNFNWKRHKFTTKIKSDPKQGAFSESVINEAKAQYMIGDKEASREDVLSYMFSNPKKPLGNTSTGKFPKWVQSNSTPDGDTITWSTIKKDMKTLEKEYGKGNVVVSGNTNGGDPVVEIYMKSQNESVVTEANYSLSKLEDMGFKAGEDYFEKVKGLLKNGPDLKAYKKGFTQGFVDNAAAYGVKESVVTEAKDDFMAKHSGTNITLKKGYKHHTEDELTDLYNKIGELVKDDLKVKDVTIVFESVVNEAKSIAKIQKEWGKVTAMMKDTVASYKEAEGQEKEDLVDQLKVLTVSKKKLEAELDAAVGLKDMDVELDEATMKNINHILNENEQIDEAIKVGDLKVGRGFKLGDDVFRIIKLEKDKKFGLIADTERICSITGTKYKYLDTAKELVDFFNEEGVVAEGMVFEAFDSIDEELNERVVTIKRRYTENYPAVTVGKSARIRNKMLEAIADGKITQEEFNTILKEMSNHPGKWSRRNAKYFNVSEDGVSLSKAGSRILQKIAINENSVNEARQSWIVYTGDVAKKFYSEHTNKKSAEKMIDMIIKKFDTVGMMTKELWEKERAEGFVTEEATPFVYESFAAFESTNLNEASFVVWYEDKEGKHLLGTFHNKRAADKYKSEEEDEVLNTVGVESIGTMSKTMWDKKEAPYIKESQVNTDNTELVTEAFKSSKLRNLLTMGGADGMKLKGLSKAFYGLTKYKLDELPDAALRDVDPQTAYKSYQKDKEFAVFYIVDNEKNNPFSDDRDWGGKINPGIIAITRAKEFLGDNRRVGTDRKLSNNAQPAGGDKRYSGWGASGIYNIKRAAEVADRAIVVWLNNDVFKSTDLTKERTEAKSGAIAFKSDADFKKANLARYREILATKASKLPLDKMVESAINELSDQIKKGLSAGEVGRYGDILIGKNKKGSEVKMRDASNHMSNILDNYGRYCSYVNEAEAEKDSGYSSGFYEKESKKYAKEVSDQIKKIKGMDYAW